MRRKVLIAGLLLAAIPIVLVGAVLLYLAFADLGAWRGTVERSVSRSLGRDLRIRGSFRPELGLTTRIVATDVTLANPDWSGDPVMVAIDRLELSIELLPLLQRHVRIPAILAEGVRLWLETDAEGRSSWTLDTPTGAPHAGTAPPIEVGAVSLRDVAASYHHARLRRSFDLELARLTARSSPTGLLELDVEGALNRAPLTLAGRLGPLDGLLSGGRFEHDLRARIGHVEIVTRGSFEGPSPLTGVDVVLDVHGPDAAELTRLFGLPSLGSGRVEIDAALSASQGEATLSLSSILGGMSAFVEARADSLAAPHELAVSVTASGADLAAAAALAGLEDLPAGPFELSGRGAWRGSSIELDRLEVRVDGHHLSADGTIGPPPRWLSSDLRIEGSGPDLAAFGRLARLDLPHGGYSIRGRLERRDRGVELDGVELRVGDATVTVDGTLGDPPGLAGSDLTVRASGPDLAVLSGMVGRRLPAAAFEVEGTLRPVSAGIALDGFAARVGAHRVALDGVIGTADRLTGTDLRLAAEGPDLAWVAGQLGITRAPAEAYAVHGRIEVRGDGLELRDVEARIADLTLAGSGRLGPRASRAGTDVTFRANGADASWLATLAGIAGMPAEPFTASGRIAADQDGYDLDRIEATVGGARLAVSGRLGRSPGLDGSDLSIRAHVPSLATFDALAPRITLPGVEASIAGRAIFEGANVRVEDGVVEVEGTRVTGGGVVAMTTDMIGSDLTIDATSPDLAAAGRLVGETGLVALPPLPAEPVALAGHLAVDQAGATVEGLRVTVGSAIATVDGRIGHPPEFLTTDVTISAHGPDASLMSAVTGAVVPPAPFRAHGRISRLDGGIRFDDVRVLLGDYRIVGNGSLGAAPHFEGTDLELNARGPSLALVRDLLGVSELPDLPFELHARCDGEPTSFTVEPLAARLGDSDVSGSVRLDLNGPRPIVEAQLTSRRVDLAEIVGGPPLARPAAALVSADPDRLVISDDPLPLSALHLVDGHIQWKLDSLALSSSIFTGVEVGVRLEDGELRVEPLRAVGAGGGTLEGAVLLDSSGATPRLDATLRLAGVPVDLTAAEDDQADWPTLDLDVRLLSTGRSPHQLARAASGRVVLVLGPGLADRSVLDRLSADVVLQVLNALNPLSGTPTSRLECGVVAVQLEDGTAVLDPFAAQSDRTTVIGQGTLDLATERLDVVWAAKPRKGLGVSASTITNAYLKLGGTLSKPKIETKPLAALTTTGVAVATGGLSLLGRGLFNRITAEKKVCAKALERAAEIAP